MNTNAVFDVGLGLIATYLALSLACTVLNEYIASIMRQSARWYEVEIVYRGDIPTGRISGDIPRNMNLSKVLEVMALSGVHFKVEDKKVIVLP